MKKLIGLLLTLTLLCACSNQSNNQPSTSPTADSGLETIVVSATAEPHATILEFIKPVLAEKGYDLQIEILDNFYIFNLALNEGDVDANYFQHVVYFDKEVKEKAYDLANAGAIHIEPFGFYSPTISSLEELQDGAKVIISNSVADHGRLLAILEENGLIKLAEGVERSSATVEDIEENSKNLNFIEVNPEMLASAYSNADGDLIGINGNYAIGAGLNPNEDALLLESGENNPYVNIVACRNGDEDSAKIQALVEALKSEETQAFILEQFGGSVIPVK